MHGKSIIEINKDLKKGAYSSLELVSHFISRIKKHDDTINSIITTCEEQAVEQAKKIDHKKDFNNPLTGIPVIHKDIICTKNIKTTCGSKMLDNFIAPYESHLSQKMQQNGMITIAKANMDEFAMGSSSENSYYGTTPNPWQLDYVSGGSSSGSAAAIAAGFSPCATGTDTGGSIRQPAAFCGISGIKPTYGRVSRYGVIAYASSLDQAGPMAKSIEDLAYILQAMSGYDNRDSTSAKNDVPDYTLQLANSIKGKKLGLPKEFINSNLPATASKLMDDFISTLKRLGADITEISLPHTKYSIPAYYIIASSECSSNLARYDGVRFGYRAKNAKNLEELYMLSRGEGFGDEVKRRIMLGTYTLSSGYYDAYYLKAQKVRRLIRDDYKNAFKKVDAIITPTTPGPSFKIGEKINDPINMYLSDIFTVGSNLAGVPALSLPIGFIDGLPFGGQIIGKHFDESSILNIGYQYQLETNWHKEMPSRFT